ncbi:hypothetical protein BDW75DRAFT_209558 [Aspergillus navahoensis]
MYLDRSWGARRSQKFLSVSVDWRFNKRTDGLLKPKLARRSDIVQGRQIMAPTDLESTAHQKEIISHRISNRQLRGGESTLLAAVHGHNMQGNRFETATRIDQGWYDGSGYCSPVLVRFGRLAIGHAQPIFNAGAEVGPRGAAVRTPEGRVSIPAIEWHCHP